MSTADTENQVSTTPDAVECGHFATDFGLALFAFLAQIVSIFLCAPPDPTEKPSTADEKNLPLRIWFSLSLGLYILMRGIPFVLFLPTPMTPPFDCIRSLRAYADIMILPYLLCVYNVYHWSRKFAYEDGLVLALMCGTYWIPASMAGLATAIGSRPEAVEATRNAQYYYILVFLAILLFGIPIGVCWAVAWIYQACRDWVDSFRPKQCRDCRACINSRSNTPGYGTMGKSDAV